MVCEVLSHFGSSAGSGRREVWWRCRLAWDSVRVGWATFLHDLWYFDRPVHLPLVSFLGKVENQHFQAKSWYGSPISSLLVWSSLHLMVPFLYFLGTGGSALFISRVLFRDAQCWGCWEEATGCAGGDGEDPAADGGSSGYESQKNTPTPGPSLKCDGVLLSLWILWYPVCGCHKMVQQNISSKGACARTAAFQLSKLHFPVPWNKKEHACCLITIAVIFLTDLSASNFFYFQINLNNDHGHYVSKSLLHAFTLIPCLPLCSSIFKDSYFWRIEVQTSSLGIQVSIVWLFFSYPYLWLPTYKGTFCFIQVEPSILPLTCHMYFCLFVYIIFLPGVSCLFSFSLCKVHSLGVCHMLLVIGFLIFHGYALSSPLDCKPLKGRDNASFGTLFSNSILHVVDFQ